MPTSERRGFATPELLSDGLYQVRLADGQILYGLGICTEPSALTISAAINTAHEKEVQAARERAYKECADIADQEAKDCGCGTTIRDRIMFRSLKGGKKS